jgi:hypothetical protein
MIIFPSYTGDCGHRVLTMSTVYYKRLLFKCLIFSVLRLISLVGMPLASMTENY